MYCIAKGKDHVQYEYGNKVSIGSTATTNIIVGAVSHPNNIYDGDTLPEVLEHIETSREKAVTQGVCDRGYRGKKEVNGTEIVLPQKALKKDNRYQRDKKRKQCRRRAAIEPIIGHLKSDFRLSRNFLKGDIGDHLDDRIVIITNLFHCFSQVCSGNGVTYGIHKNLGNFNYTISCTLSMAIQ